MNPETLLWRVQSGILSNVWAPRKKPHLHFWEKTTCLSLFGKQSNLLLQNYLLDRLKLVRQTGKHGHHHIIIHPIPTPV